MAGCPDDKAAAGLRERAREMFESGFGRVVPRRSPPSVLTERLGRLGAQDPAQLVNFTGCCLPKPFSKGHIKTGIPAGRWLRGWPADVRLASFCCAEIINGGLKKTKRRIQHGAVP